MNTARAIATFTEEQYLAVERASTEKHEYWRGHVLAMAGASFRHVDVCSNLHWLLRNALQGGACRVAGSDQRLYVRSERLYTYPDLTVVCGPREVHALREGEALLNPTVLVEVLSKSTRAYDTGDKLAFYKTIPSLREILLVDPATDDVTRWTRTARRWASRRFDRGALTLASIGATFDVAQVFAGAAPADPRLD